MKDEPGRLRIGLLLDGWMLTAWEHRLLQVLRQSDCADVQLLILNDSAPSQESFRQRLVKNAPCALYRFYTRLDNAVAREKPDAFEKTSVQELLEGVPRIHVKPRQKKFSDYLEVGDVEQIRAARLDVLVRMGFRILRGDVLRASRCGIWSYHHGDNRTLRGMPSGFWEVFENRPVTGTMLQILSEEIDDGLVLARSWSATDPGSVRNSRNRYYWKSVSLLPRKLEELHRLGEAAFMQKARRENEGLDFYDRPCYRIPSNGAFLRVWLAHAWKSFRSALRKLPYRENWQIRHGLDPAGGMRTEFWRFKPLIPPRNVGWVSPFVFAKDGVYHVFFEERPRVPGGKSHIGVIEMQKDGATSAPRKVLEQPYSVAHPFVFEHDGQTYMLPDSSPNATVDVYRAEAFPDKWVPCKTLLSGVHLVDPVLFAHDGRWWLFGNMRVHAGASASDELFLFHSDHPFGDAWTPHPMNPIVSDARKARPAGRILSHRGRFYRVSRDCSRGNGCAVNFHEILVLTESDYQEKDVDRVEPLWDPAIWGVHTFNADQGLTVIGAICRRRRWLP